MIQLQLTRVVFFANIADFTDNPFTSHWRERSRKERAWSPDVVLAVNDFAAPGAMDAIAGRGSRVPKDIAMVGFDDIEGQGCRPQRQRRDSR